MALKNEKPHKLAACMQLHAGTFREQVSIYGNSRTKPGQLCIRYVLWLRPVTEGELAAAIVTDKNQAIELAMYSKAVRQQLAAMAVDRYMFEYEFRHSIDI
jgi:hypothetical protein